MNWRLPFPRTIAARIVLALTSLVIVVVVALGAITSSLTRDAQIARLDEQVRQVLARVPAGVGPGGPGGAGRPPGPQPGPQVGPELADLGPRPLAQLVVGPDGDMQFEAAAGPPSEPYALPDVAAFPQAGIERPGGPAIPSVFTIPAVDESIEYRAVARTLVGGRLYLVAAPLVDVEATAARLRAVFLMGGGVAILFLVAGAWLIVRVGLRPTRRLAGTAAAVAAGDLSARAEDIDPASEIGGLAATFNEMLGELEEAVATRDRSQERLRQFVADAGHELRTPLTALKGYAHLYAMGALEDRERLDHALSAILENSDRMERLVEDLLTLAKLDLEQPLDVAPVDLADLVRAAAEDAAVIAPDREVVVDVDGPVPLSGDRHKLRQVLDNLLANVRAHTPTGTTVTVGANLADEGAVVFVADDGPGIPPEQLQRLFDRFYRGDPARSQDRRGSGLGLAITQAIVGAHGGRLDVDSAVGQGTTFRAWLPTHTQGNGHGT